MNPNETRQEKIAARNRDQRRHGRELRLRALVNQYLTRMAAQRKIRRSRSRLMAQAKKSRTRARLAKSKNEHAAHRARERADGARERADAARDRARA